MKSRLNPYARLWARFLAALGVGILSAGLAVTLRAQSSNTREVKPPRKRALLIGISKYQRKDNSGEWRNLNTELDLDLLQKVLIEKFEFAPGDVVVLHNELATKDNILSEWKKIVAQTAKGDVVFVHFSGHGDSIPDNNGDEIDGKDESLVPFDYVSLDDFSKNIRDDEIGKILDELKKKEPGNVTVSIDSCYSGTATRGDYAVRGGSRDIVKPEKESPSGLQDRNASYPKDYVFLAASGPRQTAKETDYDDKRRMGIYTFALVKALSEATPRTTYRDLFERVNNIITSKRGDQNPQLEGSIDELVFDGTAIRQERYVTIKPMPGGKTNDKAILQTGKLLGATEKSRYALYAAGTKDPKDEGAVKLAEGEIVQVAATSSVLKLDRQIEPAKLQTARAFETQHYYENTTLKIVLQSVGQVKGGDGVLAEFIKNTPRDNSSSAGNSSFNLAEFTEAKGNENLRGEPYDIKVYPAGEKEVKDKIVPADFRGLVMERKDGSTLATIAEGENLVGQIKTALERENRFRTINGLKDGVDPRLKIRLRLFSAEVQLDSEGRITKATPKGDLPRNTGNQAELKACDPNGTADELKLCSYVMLEIENQGELDAYVTVLNLQANGKIGPGFPQNVPGTPDNFIKRGTKLLLPLPYVFIITEPTGEESFRAIATVEPTDFTSLIDEDLITHGGSRGPRGDNAADSPLGKILLAARTGQRTGLAISVPPSWATSSVTYLVKKR